MQKRKAPGSPQEKCKKTRREPTVREKKMEISPFAPGISPHTNPFASLMQYSKFPCIYFAGDYTGKPDPKKGVIIAGSHRSSVIAESEAAIDVAQFDMLLDEDCLLLDMKKFGDYEKIDDHFIERKRQSIKANLSASKLDKFEAKMEKLTPAEFRTYNDDREQEVSVLHVRLSTSDGYCSVFESTVGVCSCAFVMVAQFIEGVTENRLTLQMCGVKILSGKQSQGKSKVGQGGKADKRG